MNILRRHWSQGLGVALLALSWNAAFSQAAGTPGATPHAIDESVPPASDNYAVGPDSLPHPGVPPGKTFKFDLKDAKIFPGTTHTITVYVPASYKGDRPACVYVSLDGLLFDLPVVFDNLIAQRAMPITIAIGVSSGTVDSANPPQNPRFDRSFEFDSRNGRLGQFLLQDVLPEVEKHRTPDNAPIRLSADPNDRAIGGASTGAIGAFTVAWEHPDAFRRVFSAIGTYVGMRGGEQYYVLVRKTEPRPIRIFMQDGVHDEWPGGPEMGDWWMSNLTMQRALEYAGYDVRHIWGTGTHNGNQAAAVFPDAMRWLWRDWPSPIRAGKSANLVLHAILKPSSDWKLAAQDCGALHDLAANQQGQVFYAGASADFSLHAIDDTNTASCTNTDAEAVFAFGSDGTAYRGLPDGGLRVSSTSTPHVPVVTLASKLHIGAVTVRSNGDIYATTNATDGQGELWLIHATGDPRLLASGLKQASGLAFSPDGLWLFVAQAASRSAISYRVQPDGTVDAGEPFYHFYVPDWADDSGAATVAMDTDGRAFVATRMGVQIFDRNGRSAAILPLPANAPATSLCFGGHDFDTLYVAAGGKVYRRKLAAHGAPPWAAPIQLPTGNAG
jgi:sugar lactone lactonase YvrE/enterochelin esterase-like enzyme